MRPQVAKYSFAGEGLDQCLLGKARYHQAGLATVSRITLSVRALCLNTFCLLLCEASLCHHASVCHRAHDGPHTLGVMG